MVKRKKAKDADVSESASVAELGLDFSDESSDSSGEEEDEEEAIDFDGDMGSMGTPTSKTKTSKKVPRESVVETPALWSGHVSFCGALPFSTWPGGNPQKKGPLSATCDYTPPNANGLNSV